MQKGMMCKGLNIEENFFKGSPVLIKPTEEHIKEIARKYAKELHDKYFPGIHDCEDCHFMELATEIITKAIKAT